MREKWVTLGIGITVATTFNIVMDWSRVAEIFVTLLIAITHYWAFGPLWGAKDGTDNQDSST